MSKLIVFEGMPGAGKTTLIDYLTKRDISSVYFAVEQLVLDPVLNEEMQTSIQYIDTELERVKRALQTSLGTPMLLFDRNALATLAFRYAKSRVEHKEREYLKLVEYFTTKTKLSDIRPDLLVLMDVSIEESLNRRKDFSKNPLYKTWFDREFLLMLQEFYRNWIPDICMAHNNLCIDTTNLSVDEVASNVQLFINRNQ